jgi:hypothetical protein
MKPILIHRVYPQGRLVVDKPFRHAAFQRNSYPHIDTNDIVQPRTRGRLRIAKALCLAMLAGLLLSPFAANADSIDVTHQLISIDSLKLYAHSRIVNYKQFQCFNSIITKESHWNYKAHNGSHWGLGQMKSDHYKNLDPFRQIDQSLKYMIHRYKSPCNAWLHHQKHNWF